MERGSMRRNPSSTGADGRPSGRQPQGDARQRRTVANGGEAAPIFPIDGGSISMATSSTAADGGATGVFPIS
ncbi:hypothetical protein ACLOJK_003949 [Asimina triloba]